jgi:DNA mismatch endonuclease (patch repair protein)
MAVQARRDTAPEIALRSALHREGIRFNVTYRVPGMPRRTIDIAFPRLKLAVFVDGCFWHGCPVHGTAPRANSEWWCRKIATNQQRDLSTTKHLGSLGWTVIRVWEHDCPEPALASVRARLVAARSLQ